MAFGWRRHKADEGRREAGSLAVHASAPAAAGVSRPDSPPAPAPQEQHPRLEVLLRRTQAQRMAGRIAGDVGHDFNNSLAIIAGSLDLLEHRIGVGSEVPPSKLLALIARARDAVQRAADLAAGLHGLSRLRPGPARPTDLAALLVALAPLLASVAGRRVHLHMAPAPELPLAQVDPGQLKAALVALCLNAREAMAEGGDVSLDLAADTTPAGSFIRLRVIDSGLGMTPEVAAHAAEPFFTTRGPEAAGLGLTEVIAFAREAGGEVQIETAAGTGTTVSVLLPCAVVPASGGPGRAGPADEPG